MPFIFRDLDHVYETLDGEIGEKLLNKLKGSGFLGLGLWKMEEEQRQSLIANGVEVVEVSELDLNSFREAVQPVYDNFSSLFGDYVDRIKAIQ